MSHKTSQQSGSEKCKVCHQPSHGVHFGVISCRACAAFFRRSIVLNKNYFCRRADSKCDIETMPRDFCRHCRLRKCKSLGMTEDNVQRNRDTLKPSVIECPGLKRTSGRCPLFDMSSRMDEILKDFAKFKIPEDDLAYMSRNSLEKMNYALQKGRTIQNKDDIQIMTSVEPDGSGLIWNRINKQCLEWMMHSAEFRKLEPENQFRIFNYVWLPWLRFKRLTMSLEIFGQRTIDEKILMVTDTHAMYIGGFKYGGSLSKSHDSDRIHEMFNPLEKTIMDNVAKPLLEIEPTSMEVTYMLCQIVWQPSGKKFQGEILLAGEKFLDEIANNLHTYYKSQKCTNYASRLAQMMGVVRAMQRNHEDLVNIYELAQLFDVFKI